MEEKGNQPRPQPRDERAEERPAYEAPRIVKKRSVSRATLFTGGGPDSGGMVGI